MKKIIILLIIFAGGFLLISSLTKQDDFFNKEAILNLNRQCYFKEFDFTQENSPYLLKDFGFFSFSIENNNITGEELYLRAEAGSYVATFSGTVEERDSIFYVDAVRREDFSEEEIGEEAFRFQFNQEGVLFGELLKTSMTKNINSMLTRSNT